MSSEFLYALLPEHLLLGAALTLLLLEMLDVSEHVANALVTVVLATAAAVLLQQQHVDYRATLAGGELVIDAFALSAKSVLVGCALLHNLALSGCTSIKSRFLLCSSLFGALIMLDSAGFTSLFIGLETLSLPAFALMVHACGNSASSEGAFKYLLLSSVATALVLFGAAFAYGASASLEIGAFVQAIAGGSSEARMAGLLVMSGFFMKAAVFPFHGWAPDAYTAAKLEVTGFLAAIVKAAVVFGLLRIFMNTPLDEAAVAVVAALAVLSIYFGNIAALKQSRFKRLLAYSSIAHAGYMMIAFTDVTGARIHDLLWYTAIYAATVLVACASFAALTRGEHDELDVLEGALRRRPAAALLFGLAMLSLAGVPPLPGFFAKLFVFSSVVASERLSLAVLAFVGSFIGVTYYLKLFFRVFSTEPLVAEPEHEAAVRRR